MHQLGLISINEITCIMMSVVGIVLVFCLQYAKCSILEHLIPANIPEDGRLRFCDLANKYNMDCIRYNVTTEDGYILGVFNIPGDKTRPIFLQHGLLDSSDTFLLRTNMSWVYYLAEEGFDLWLGNVRGNQYSRAHVSLDPKGLKFWDFSFHEIAKYDMPAMIDFVLEKTEQEQLQVISHSQGTTIMFVLGVLRPEYSKKLKIVICFAPSAYLHYSEQPVFNLLSLTAGPVLSPVSSVLGHGEILRNSSELAALLKGVCTIQSISNELCMEAIVFPLVGRDRTRFESKFLSTAFGHFPAGSSLKNVIHLFQIAMRREFCYYDYGFWSNIVIYKNANPPKYDFRKNVMKMALVVGAGDRLADLKDISILRRELGNVVDYHLMEPKEWNHIDYLWGNSIKRDLFGYVYELLNKYM